MTRAGRRRAADRVGAELARERLVEVELRHDPSYPGFSTVIAKSPPSQRSPSDQKNVKRIGAASWMRSIVPGRTERTRRLNVHTSIGGFGRRPWYRSATAGMRSKICPS